MDSEERLLRAAQRLDPDALAEVYDVYNSAIYRYALRQLGDEALAEDCVAETFGRFLRALHARRGPTGHLQAYLYRIAHNWITDVYRARDAYPLPEQTVLTADEQLAPPSVVDKDEEVARLRRALGGLTPDQRQVIALKYLEGWDNCQVARALGKPVGAVKSLQHRALAALRRLLGGEE